MARTNRRNNRSNDLRKDGTANDQRRTEEPRSSEQNKKKDGNDASKEKEKAAIALREAHRQGREEGIKEAASRQQKTSQVNSPSTQRNTTYRAMKQMESLTGYPQQVNKQICEQRKKES